MLFINEEGTENGGLIQKGSIEADGKVDAGLSLTFDRFRQDQAVQLINTDSASRQMSGLRIRIPMDEQSTAARPAVRVDPVRLLKLRLHPAGHLFFEKEKT